MDHWPGHERIQITGKSKDKGKHKEHRLDPSYWRWPHLEYGSTGSATLISKDGRVQWSTLANTCHNTRWYLGKTVKVFPETRSPQVSTNEHSSRKRVEKGLHYLRSHFPDADFPGEIAGGALEADIREMQRLTAFDPFLKNLLEIMPSHQVRNERIVVFPMGELGRELNISRISLDELGHTVFIPTGSPSIAFETPILQISSAVWPSQWISTPFSAVLVRTHTSSSLLRVECSKVTRELDITRSEVGDVPIADSRILASGPDMVVVNRSGMVYKCNAYHGGKAIQFIRAHEDSDNDLWQLGVTGRNDECFLTSCKAVKHIDLRSANSVADVFSLQHPSTLVTSFESPMDNYISRITTTSDVVWLDDRFRRRPLLSFKHGRSFDRTLRVLTASISGASLSLLASKRNGLVSLYDVSGGTDNFLHCNSSPSCLPHTGPILTPYSGHALVAFPSDEKLMFLRLCQRGSVHRQDIRVIQHGEDQQESIQEEDVAHQWDEDVLTLDKRASELQIDFGPAGERHFSKVNLRGAYEKMFAVRNYPREDMDQNRFSDMLTRLPDAWQDIEKTAENMLTTLDVISGIEDDSEHSSHANGLAGSNIDSMQVLDGLMCGHSAIRELAGRAEWHYNIQETFVSTLKHCSADCPPLDGYLKELNLVAEVERHDSTVQHETEARKQLVVDLALSKDVYSARPFAKLHSVSAGEGISGMEMSYDKEPPEVQFGYFAPIRKIGGNHYTDKEHDKGQDPDFSSPIGVRLLLAEWELGTDPNDYTYRDPYGVVDIEAQPTPEYRKLPPTPQATQKRQGVPQRPPLVVAAATQPSLVQTVVRAPVADPRQVESQQYFEETVMEEPMASTQVLPGRFGGRRKAGKKRVGGF